MNKSDLIQRLQQRYPHLPASDVELAVKGLLEQLTETLSTGDRIEIRGFGSFSLRRRESGLRRNPRTGEPVAMAAHYVPHFKPGKDWRGRVNAEGSNQPGFPRLVGTPPKVVS